MVRLKEHPERKHPLIAFARTFFPKSRRSKRKGGSRRKRTKGTPPKRVEGRQTEKEHQVVVIITVNKTSQVAEKALKLARTIFCPLDEERHTLLDAIKADKYEQQRETAPSAMKRGWL